MNTQVKTITEVELRSSIRKALQVIAKKADRQGIESVLKLWEQIAKEAYIEENSVEGIQTEILFQKKDGSKQWLTTLPAKMLKTVESMEKTPGVSIKEPCNSVSSTVLAVTANP